MDRNRTGKNVNLISFSSVREADVRLVRILHLISGDILCTVLTIIKLTIGMERECIASNCIIIFITFANSLEPGETPIISASHQAPDYLPIVVVMCVAVDIRSIKVDNRMEWTGTGPEKRSI